MQNFKEFCLYFSLLMVSKVICSPLVYECKISPDMMSTFNLDENIKNCHDDTDMKYCAKIKELEIELENKLSDCDLVKQWKVKEVNEKITNDYKKGLQSSDVCVTFGSMQKVLNYASVDEKSIGIIGMQLSKNKQFCEEFCKINNDICTLILKLQWIKSCCLHIKEENLKTETVKNFEALKATTAKILKHNPTTNQHSTGDKDDKTKDDKTKDDKTKDDKTKDDKTKPLALDSNAVKSTSKISNEINDDNSIQSTDSQPIENKKKNPVLPDDNKNQKNSNNNNNKAESSEIAGDTLKISNLPNENKNINGDSQSRTTVSSTEETKDTMSIITPSQVQPSNSEPSEKTNTKDIYIKPENDKNIENSAGKSVAEVKDKVPIKPLEDSLQEPENDPNLPEKNDKTEFGSQANDFSDEFPETANEYGDDEPPLDNNISTSKAGKKEESSSKKLAKEPVKENEVTSGFPEEEDSHFFAYFLTIVVLCIAGYLVFHNKQKIIALIIEGRHERRRRPNGGGYKRLDSKEGGKTTSQVIF